MADIPLVAASLTSLERSLMCDDELGWGSWMWDVGMDLVRKGLMARVGPGKIDYTDLGLLVKAYLLHGEES
jgi:hypothetical protein